jgi:hypothetical protein
MADIIRTQVIAFDAPERRASTTQTDAAVPSACCGGPAPTGIEACCARDAEVKSTGGTGCGCGSVPKSAAPAPKKTGCCG